MYSLSLLSLHFFSLNSHESSLRKGSRSNHAIGSPQHRRFRPMVLRVVRNYQYVLHVQMQVGTPRDGFVGLWPCKIHKMQVYICSTSQVCDFSTAAKPQILSITIVLQGTTDFFSKAGAWGEAENQTFRDSQSEGDGDRYQASKRDDLKDVKVLKPKSRDVPKTGEDGWLDLHIWYIEHAC